MKPVLLEIVTRMITTLGNCRACEVVFDRAGFGEKISQKQVSEYPPELIQESERLSQWLGQLKELYKHRLSIRLIDAKSFLGVCKSVRHWIRRYPTFIVDGKETYTGWDKNRLEDLIDKYIQASIRSRNESAQTTFP